jgi:heme/copper-type cytochrome/quinol oxidase subunit 3
MSEVTRSGRGGSAVAASYAARRRLTQPNGWWGVALLVATETAFFGTLLASYFYLRFASADWPPAGIEQPAVALPLALTGVLVATAPGPWLALRAGRRGDARATRLWLLLAAAIQIAYLVAQGFSFASDLGDFSPRDTAYGSIYFTMLGAHHAHVALGVLLELGALALLLRGLTNYRLVGVQAIALYWSFVDAVAVLVVLTQISPSL